MTDTRTASENLSDALGDDVVYLQPPDEQRFDPVSVGAVVGLGILKAVAEGIRDGIKDAAADRTKAVLPAIGAGVRDRLPRWLRDAFSRRQADHAEVSAELGEAALAAGSLDAGSRRDLPRTVAAAAREALEAEGLPTAAAQRVEKVLVAQIEAELT